MSRSSLPWLVVGPPFGAGGTRLRAVEPREAGGAGHWYGRLSGPSLGKLSHRKSPRIRATTERRLSETATHAARSGMARTNLAYRKPRATFAIATDLGEPASFPLSPEGDSLQRGFLWKSSP
jgi:hypothetical protein